MSEQCANELPIAKHRELILNTIRKNEVTLIVGTVGCGKTTLVPQYLLEEAEQTNEKVNIIVGQPRKIAAITIAQKVARDRQCNLGALVGYQVGLDKKMNKSIQDHDTAEAGEKTQLLFCTMGVLLQKIIQKKSIESYTHIILDEIHERAIDTDLLFVTIRELLLHSSNNTKLILMSATLNPVHLQEYFNSVCKAPVIMITNPTNFQVDIKYLDDVNYQPAKNNSRIKACEPLIPNDLYQLAAKIIIHHLDGSESNEAILVFLPGIYEIETLHSILESYEELSTENCLICTLHSSLPLIEQKIAFTLSDKPKVILSSNIAECSVTLPGVFVIIDFCLTKTLNINKQSMLSSLKMEWASKYNCIQRAGRTGRVCDGTVYRLVTRHFYENFEEEIVPEILRSPLETTFLRVKLLDYEDPHTLLSKCVSPPKEDAILHAIMTLKELGGLKRLDRQNKFNKREGDITLVGRLMAALPIDVHLSKLIVLGYTFSVTEECIIIAAGLNNKSIFRDNFRDKMESYKRKLVWANGTSCDGNAILNAFLLWKNKREEGHLRERSVEELWCGENNLDRRSLHEMNQLINEIKNRMSNFPFDASSASWTHKEKSVIIKVCMAGAFLSNFFIHGQSNERDAYKCLNNLDPYNTVYLKNMDRKLVGKVYAKQIKDSLLDAGIVDATENIKVHFDGEKIFIQFPSALEKIDNEKYEWSRRCSYSSIPGKIAPEVYKCLKYRQVNLSNFELKTLSPEDTKEYAIKQGIGKYDEDGFKLIDVEYEYPGLCILPNYNVTKMSGFITHVDHCNKFYFQPRSKELEDILDDIEYSLYNTNLVCVKNPTLHQLVIANYGILTKRAKIVRVYENSADCFFFDYGYVKGIDFENMFEVSQEILISHFTIPPRCFECTLAEVEPFYVTCPRGIWTEESVAVFATKVVDKLCEIEVYSVVNDKVAVKLFVGSENINKYVINEGFGRKCEEPHPSRVDRDLRMKLLEENWQPDPKFSEKKVNTVFCNEVPSPPLNRCEFTVKLHGPMSPLEKSLNGVANHEFGKINIDPMSVNSVILSEVEEYEGKLVVAADVSQNKIGSTILHHTSVLPKITGLPVLLALIFAKDVVFYRKNSKINAIKYGLGAYRGNQNPFFEKNDCVLPVNFDLSPNDGININHLRLKMSYLVKECDDDDKPVPKDLNEIKKLMLNILNKDRKLTLSSGTEIYADDSWKVNYERHEEKTCSNLEYNLLTFP